MSVYEPASYTTYEDNTRRYNNRRHSQKPQICSLYMITHLIISFFAVYLSWRCNDGFNIISFTLALVCPYLYIIWALATKGGCGIFNECPQVNSNPFRVISF